MRVFSFLEPRDTLEVSLYFANCLAFFMLRYPNYCWSGSVLRAILASHPRFSVTALVRNQRDLESVRAIGVTSVVHGSHEDLKKIEDLASQADIIVNAADADDLPLTKAILQGLKTRHTTVGYKPILIHTSGTGVISDQAEGEFLPSGQKIWNVRSDYRIPRSICSRNQTI